MALRASGSVLPEAALSPREDGFEGGGSSRPLVVDLLTDSITLDGGGGEGAGAGAGTGAGGADRGSVADSSDEETRSSVPTARMKRVGSLSDYHTSRQVSDQTPERTSSPGDCRASCGTATQAHEWVPSFCLAGGSRD